MSKQGTSRRDKPKDTSQWSTEDKRKLLYAVKEVVNGDTSCKLFQSVIKWENIKIDGKSSEECRTMFKKMTVKVKKFRTAKDFLDEATELVTERRKPTKNEVNNSAEDEPKVRLEEQEALCKKEAHYFAHFKSLIKHPGKRPLQAFSLFIKERSKEFPFIRGPKSIKLFASEWNNLSKETKETYKKKSKERFLRYSRTKYPAKQRITLKESRSISLRKSQRIALKKSQSITLRKSQREQPKVKVDPSPTPMSVELESTKDQERIVHLSERKPVPALPAPPAPPKNLFWFFCKKWNILCNPSTKKKSRALSPIYKNLTDEEINSLVEAFTEEVNQYEQKYTQHYYSLPEEGRKEEEAPEYVLAAYRKVLQRGFNKKKKKSSRTTAESDSTTVLKLELPDMPSELVVISDSDSEDSVDSSSTIVAAKWERESNSDSETQQREFQHDTFSPNIIASAGIDTRKPQEMHHSNPTSQNPIAPSQNNEQVNDPVTLPKKPRHDAISGASFVPAQDDTLGENSLAQQRFTAESSEQTGINLIARLNMIENALKQLLKETPSTSAQLGFPAELSEQNNVVDVKARLEKLENILEQLKADNKQRNKHEVCKESQVGAGLVKESLSTTSRTGKFVESVSVSSEVHRIVKVEVVDNNEVQQCFPHFLGPPNHNK